MDEGTLHMARAMVNMSIHEDELYATAAAVVTGGTKTDKTAVGKVKMQDKLQSFRYDGYCYYGKYVSISYKSCIARGWIEGCNVVISPLGDFFFDYSPFF